MKQILILCMLTLMACSTEPTSPSMEFINTPAPAPEITGDNDWNAQTVKPAPVKKSKVKVRKTKQQRIK